MLYTLMIECLQQAAEPTSRDPVANDILSQQAFLSCQGGVLNVHRWNTEQARGLASIMVIQMGSHLLKNIEGPQLLYQVNHSLSHNDCPIPWPGKSNPAVVPATFPAAVAGA